MSLNFLLLALVLQTCSAEGKIKFADDPNQVYFNYFCTGPTVISNKNKFPYPPDPTKYILCTDIGYGKVLLCPAGKEFEIKEGDCRVKTTPKTVLCKLPPGTDSTVPAHSLKLIYPNPCSSNTNCYFFRHHKINTSFIECTGKKALVWSCQTNLVWIQDKQHCEVTRVKVAIHCDGQTNPCKVRQPNEHLIKAHEMFFACLKDPQKFIQCNRWGKMYIKKCQGMLFWNELSLSCGPQLQIVGK